MATRWRVTADGRRQHQGPDGVWRTDDPRAIAVTTRAQAVYLANLRQIQRKNRRRRIFLIVFLVVVAIAIIVGAVSGDGGTGYKASVESVIAISPKTAEVTVHVSNTSSTPVKPSCTIKITLPTAAHGVTTFTATHTLDAGTEGAYVVPIRVTTTKAGTVIKSDVSLTC